MFYLNSKRDVPFSKSWHESAAYSSDDNNTCGWAVLKDKKTGVSAVYASTHLKPVGSFLARKLTNYRQAVNLAEGLYELSVKYADEGGTLPIAVGGDFNANTATPFNKSYAHLTEHAHYSDAQKVAAKECNGLPILNYGYVPTEEDMGFEFTSKEYKIIFKISYFTYYTSF